MQNIAPGSMGGGGSVPISRHHAAFRFLDVLPGDLIGGVEPGRLFQVSDLSISTEFGSRTDQIENVSPMGSYLS